MAQSQYTTFYIDQNLFGLEVGLISEINRNLAMTPVDLAPPYVRGLLNLRGQIVTIIDLGVRLAIGERAIGPASRSIILKTAEELERRNSPLAAQAPRDMVALLVDRIGDMVSIDQGELEVPPANIDSIDSRYIAGIVKLEDELLKILKPAEIISLEN